MALLDSHSCECVKSELDLFSVPPTQTSVEQTQYKEYYPISLTTSNAPIEFHVSSSDEEYLDLNQSYLHMTVSIRDADGTVLAPPARDTDEEPPKNHVFPVNYFASTQFKNVEVMLSGTQVSPSDVQYAYRAFLETTLSYGDGKREQLQSAMYYPDVSEPDLHDASIADPACANPGARERYLKTQNSGTFEMITSIHHSLFTQPKLLLGKVDMRLKFHRHDPKFSLMSTVRNVNYRIHVDKVMLMVCHKRIAASVREAHEKALMKSPAKYSLRTSDIKFFTKSAGSADLSEPNVHTGILPRKVVVGLVKSAGFNGSYHHSPFNFAPFDLMSIQLRRNGVALPYEALEMNYDNGHILPGYISLFQGMGRLFDDHTINISSYDYVHSGFTLYVFDVTQDGAGDCNLSLLQEGKLSLHIKLRQALPESATVVIYMEKEGLIEIDKDRNVSYEQ
jgi:hypothetical protein